MTQRCDLLVVGLGPAGGAAAGTAARRGLRVIALERKRVVGLPVQCAEFVPLPLGRWTRDSGVCLQRIEAMESKLPSGHRERTPFPGLMVDRAAFDQAIVRAARDAGAQVQTGTRLVSIDLTRRRAWAEGPDGPLEVEFKLLVAADGPRSRVAQALGLPPLECVETRQYTVPLTRPSAVTEVWLSNDYPGGYAWLFPKGPWANLGLGLDRAFAPDLKEPLEALHRQLQEEGRVGREIVSRTGGLIPVGGLRRQLVEGPLLFAGDAAGLTHPITGAGIAAAIISGERAGEAAAHYLGGRAQALEDFEEDVRDQFQTSIERAVERRRWLDERWHTPAAKVDATYRRGWIAFGEYFA